MIRFLVIMGVTLGCLLTNVRCGQAQAGGFDPSVAGAGLNLGNLGMGLGGGEAMPGAILLKIKGEGSSAPPAPWKKRALTPSQAICTSSVETILIW